MLKKLCLFLMIIALLPGCQKLLDYYNYPNAPGAPDCKITRITNANDVDSSAINFMYNAQGYPISFTSEYFDLSGGYSNEYSFTFEYDNQNRIISQISDWVYSEPEVHYAYEGASRLPVRDTIINAPGGLVEVEDLEYDNSGRLIKLTRRVIEQWFGEEEIPDQTFRYYYDLRGNRQEDPTNSSYPGLIPYSDKPSLHRLHPVWQVMFKDWSKNSVLKGKTYHVNGLPAHIEAGTELYENFLGCYPGSTFTYECN